MARVLLTGMSGTGKSTVLRQLADRGHRTDEEVEVSTDRGPLDMDRAVLLRRIHRGEDVRRRLTREQQRFIRPWLHNSMLIDYTNGPDRLRDPVAMSLDLPTAVEAGRAAEGETCPR